MNVGRLSLTAIVMASLLGCGDMPEEDLGTAVDAWHSADFDAEYIDCDEYAGVGVVPLANVINRVPADYTVIEPIAGFALVVAQAGSCEEIRVNGSHPRPGIFAQFGVGVVPPNTAGNGDFYQLMFSTNHRKLARKMRRLGVRARFSSKLSYSIANSTLNINVDKPRAFAFQLSDPIVLPDPTAPPNPTSIFNYYAQGKHRFGNILQENVVEGIRFGEGDAVTLTAVGNKMLAITGPTLSFPFFSKPEVFDRTDLFVQTNSF